MVTTAGLMRSHRASRKGMADCPGAGQRPTSSPVTPTPAPTRSGLPPPTEPTFGRSCDGGHCTRPSIGWRLYRGQPDWLPVCGSHMDGPAGRTRIYDDQIQPEET
jgi:hypothetical protein